MLTRLMGAIAPQYALIWNHYAVPLKLVECSRSVLYPIFKRYKENQKTCAQAMEHWKMKRRGNSRSFVPVLE